MVFDFFKYNNLKLVHYSDDLDIFNTNKWIKFDFLENLLDRIINEVRKKEITINYRLKFNNNELTYFRIEEYILNIYSEKIIKVQFKNFIMKFIDKNIWPYIIQHLTDIVYNLEIDENIKDELNFYLMSNLEIAS